jgi:hypothetical protein
MEIRSEVDNGAERSLDGIYHFSYPWLFTMSTTEIEYPALANFLANTDASFLVARSKSLQHEN